jgi:hypothetical protein
LLFAFVKAFQDRRAPWYQRGLIRKPLRKIGVILLHNVEREIALVLGKYLCMAASCVMVSLRAP